jgi:hypothetical protein
MTYMGDGTLRPYYVLISEAGYAYVKDADFFKAQGGLTEPWGKNWKLVDAYSFEDAKNRVWHMANGDSTSE